MTSSKGEELPGPGRVLLVEDNHANALIIRRYLMASANPTSEIVWVELLHEALNRLEKLKFDIILLDLMLPDSEGVETLERIVNAAPDVPVVVLSGHDDDSIAKRCIDFGAQDYLNKAVLTRDNLRTAVSFAQARFREMQAKLLRMVDLSNYVFISGPVAVPITRELCGSATIREREPLAYEKLQRRYRELLLNYVNYLKKRVEKPRIEMEVLASVFGDYGATPRDIVDVHTTSLDEIKSSLHGVYAYTFVSDSRLFALEVMGLLLEYYRTGFRRLDAGRLAT